MSLKPMEFTAEEVTALQNALKSQVVGTSRSKSRDPENYPVFEPPVNAKVLIYVPNHVVTNASGMEELRMDTPNIHAIKEGNRFSYARCVAGLGGVVRGYPEGCECPFCKAVSDSWSLSRKIIEEKCAARGLDPDDTANEEVKSIRTQAFSDRVVKDATKYYTFPIIVIETDPTNIKKFVYDDEGNLQYKAMWYNISERAYEEKWLKALEGLEDSPSHPGGRCFILNYTYQVKPGQQPNKRDSARALVVTPRNLGGDFNKYKEYFDQVTEDWTVFKAYQTVVNNTISSYESVVEEADRIMLPSRERLEMYQISASTSNATGGFLLNGATGNGAAPVNKGNAGLSDDDDDMLGGMETDMD